MASIPFRAKIAALSGLIFGSSGTGPTITSGTGSPEGVVTAPVGSLYMREDGTADTTLYRKESGSGNTGWVASNLSRITLTADRTYYVRTDGNDSNNGLSNTSGGAFLTLQKAWDTVSGLDVTTHTVTIQVGAGTYANGITFDKGPTGAGNVNITGDSTTPSNVVISQTTGNLFAFSNPQTVAVTIDGFKLTGAGSTSVLINVPSVCRVFVKNIEYGSTGNYHIQCTTGGSIQVTGNCSISGGAKGHINCTEVSWVRERVRTITFLANVTFSTAFVIAKSCSSITADGNTYNLNGFTVTGTRYDVQLNSVINTAGAAADYFPGSVAGTTATGGQIV